MIINEIETKKGYRYILVDENMGDILCSLYVLFEHKDIPTAKICRVSVNKKFRGKGYAKELLGFVVNLYSELKLHLNACPYGDDVNKINFEERRKKLKKLYSLFGFKSKPNTKTVMIRTSNTFKNNCLNI